MISKDEIEQKSAQFEINIADVQRDYIFGWLLSGIYSVSELKNIFILKGGNCLRKAYFENTRYSNDLDFSTVNQLSPEFIHDKLSKVCDYIHEKTEVRFEKDRNKVQEKKRIDTEKLVYEAKLYFKDFYGNSDSIIISVRLDITPFDRIYLPTQKRKLLHPYSDGDKCVAEIHCVKLEEILASKLKCLLQRRHSSDFYDYAHSIILNEQIEINKSEVVSTFLSITIFERSPGFAKKLFLELPFEMLKRLWLKFLTVPKNGLIQFEHAVEKFIKHIAELFEEFGDIISNPYFFPPEFRNCIMEAAYNMTLLKVRYNGYERIIEPYSLTFKIRKDGVGREYFYVWDRTGGNSGPGDKTFLHQNISHIENTEEKFEPRYDVELTKAGEYSNKTYFTATRKHSSTGLFFTQRTRKSKTSSVKYVYQCYTCNKQFTKSTRSSKLNEHKNKQGHKCYSRSGYFVKTKYP